MPRSVNRANHSGKVTGLLLSATTNTLTSVGFDDRLRVATLTDGATPTYEGGAETPLPGQPVAIAAGAVGSDLAAVIYRPAGLAVYRGGGAEKAGEVNNT